MRLRPFAALSAVALSAILLAGCSGSGGGDATPSASASGAADLCSSAAPSGAVSDGITVTGDFGAVPTVDFTKPVDTTDLTLQRTVQTEGSGAPIAAGDFVQYAATILDGSTGAVLSQAGYTPGEILPEQISAENGGQIFGCATIGSRLTLATTTGVVAGFQKALEGQTAGSQVLVTMTPADGYGEGEINTTDLKGETLVFVIDILGTAPAATQ